MHGVTANRDTPLRGGITKDEKINTSRIGKKIERRIDRSIEKKKKEIERIGRKFERTRIIYRKLLLEKILLIRSVRRYDMRVTRLTFEWKYALLFVTQFIATI